MRKPDRCADGLSFRRNSIGIPVWLLPLFQLLDVPIQRPAIPLAVRQQDKVQQHVDELRSGDIPILSQASPDL
jgi:hypothetical protein